MTSNLKTVLLAGTAALAVALGAAAAHAGGYQDMLAAQQAAALADSDSDPISEAVEAAATDMIVDTLLGDGDDE